MAASGAQPSGSGYYQYMFNGKEPTAQFEALLRAIGQHIIDKVGDKNIRALQPPKLAAFWKSMGGDFDTFCAMPESSISYVFQVTGCAHSLQQPYQAYYHAPTIPTLTLDGFVTFIKIETLLGPAELVPLLQQAVAHLHLEHPDTGEIFPPDLPAECFPAEPDAETDQWYRKCIHKLKEEIKDTSGRQHHASPARSSGGERPHDRPADRREADRVGRERERERERERDRSERMDPRFYAAGAGAAGAAGGYAFGRYSQRATSPRMPPPNADYYDHHYPRHRAGRRGHRDGSSSDERLPRRSASAYPSPPPHDGAHSRPHKAPSPHALPRRKRSNHLHSDSESADDEGPPSPPRGDRKPRHGDAPPRRHGPSIVTTAPPPASPSLRPRTDVKADDPKRKSMPQVIRDRVNERLNAFVDGKRRSNSTRSSAGRPAAAQTAASNGKLSYRERDKLRHVHVSDQDFSEPLDTDEDRKRRRHLSDRDRDRDRERDRDRGRLRARERELDREEAEELHERYRRPDVLRRTSSHADVDRRKPAAWDADKWEERLKAEDRIRSEEKLSGSGGSTIEGVGRRRYPSDPPWS